MPLTTQFLRSNRTISAKLACLYKQLEKCVIFTIKQPIMLKLVKKVACFMEILYVNSGFTNYGAGLHYVSKLYLVHRRSVSNFSLANNNQWSSYHHANIVTSAVFGFFNGFVQYKVHEWIKTSQYSNDTTTGVQFQRQFLVHEPENKTFNDNQEKCTVWS